MGHKHWAQMDRLVRGEPCQGGGLVEGVVINNYYSDNELYFN